MVCIDIKALRAGVHEFDWTLNVEQLDLDPSVFSNLELFVRLDFHQSRIFVTLNTRATARLTCDRTLVDFEQPVLGEYHLLFSGPEFFEGVEEDGEDVRLLAPDMEEIDLTDAVRDTFLLSLPYRRVAPGAEDEDIPLQFGAPENGDGAIDPRWEALKALYSEENTSRAD